MRLAPLGVGMALLALACAPLSNADPPIGLNPYTTSALFRPTDESYFPFGLALTTVDGGDKLVVVGGTPNHYGLYVAETSDEGPLEPTTVPDTAEYSVLYEDDQFAIAGDIDGDGADEVVRGAVRDRSYFLALYLDGDTTVEVEPPEDGARFGLGVATGDLTGDGTEELIVGAPYTAREESGFTGAVWIFRGGNLDDRVELVCDDPGIYGVLGNFGEYLDAGGDTDGDGIAELVVSGGQDGYVRTWEGDADALVDAGSMVRVGRSGGPYNPERMGTRLEFAGDINGDGYDELLAGSPEDNTYGSSSSEVTGEARLYYGTPDGLDETTEQVFYPEDFEPRQNFFGWSLASGDMDGDGFSDLAIVSTDAGPDGTRVFLYFGRPAGITGEDREEMAWPEQGGARGGIVALGDVDTDGAPDLLLAQPNIEGEYPYTGGLVWWGSR